MDLIRSSFKNIVSEMKEKRDKAILGYQALREIPSSLADKRSLFQGIKEEIWKGINTKTLDGQLSFLDSDEGDSDGEDMSPSAKFHEASKSYKDILSKSKLANISTISLKTSVVVVEKGKEYRGEVCFVDEDNDKVYLKGITSESNVKNVINASKKKGKPDNIIREKGSVYIERYDGSIDKLKGFRYNMARTDPQWISKFIKKNRPYKLPIFINTHVFEAIVARLIAKDWAGPTVELLDFTSSLMDNAAEEFIEDITRVKSFPYLVSHLKAKASEVVEYLKGNTKNKINEFIKREQVPYTQNHYLFENVCKLRSESLMEEVLSSLPKTSGSSDGDETVPVNPTSLASTLKNIFKRNQEKSVDEHMAEEMQHALDSYGKVALKRFIDNVPMICIEIMQNFADRMNGMLSEITDEEIERLMVAPPILIDTKNNLKRKGDTLDKGIATIRGLI